MRRKIEIAKLAAASPLVVVDPRAVAGAYVAALSAWVALEARWSAEQGPGESDEHEADRLRSALEALASTAVATQDSTAEWIEMLAAIRLAEEAFEEQGGIDADMLALVQSTFELLLG